MKTVNQLINIFWSALGFSAVIIHWYSARDIMWFCIALLLSTLILFFPLGFLQLGVNRKFYERLGIRLAQKVVQDGVWVNKMRRKINPSHHILNRNKRQYK